jgi:hypothetical protein
MRSPARSGGTVRTVRTLLFFTAAVGAAVVTASACGDDEPTIAFIGLTDASPPRLGRESPDGGNAGE